MKRVGVLICAVLALFLISSVNPLACSIPAHRVNEASTPFFSVAEDGAESSQSLTVFAETSADDTMMYSDIEQAETNQYGFSSGVSLENTISVHSMDCTTDDFVAFNYPEGGSAGSTSNTADMLNISSPSDHVYVTWFQCEGYLYHNTLAFYLNDASGGPWTLNYYYGASWTSHATVNFTTSDIGSVVEFDMSSWPYFGTARYEFEFETAGWFELDWNIVTENPDYELDSWTGFSESFSNVSDWTTSDVSITTDGDVATITENGAGSTGRAYASFSSTDYFEYYYEFRIYSMTATTANLEFWDGAAYNTLETFTAAGTYKGIISDADAATMQRIGFLVGSEGGNVKPDYLRVGKSTEMGWQHDCSTTSGTDAASSDSDLINVTSSITFDIDTTATAALVETSYYPFLDVFVDDGAGNILVEVSADGSSWTTTITTTIFASTHYRYNTQYIGIDIKQVRVNVTSWATLDFCQLYGIANWSVWMQNDDGTDFMYVENSRLYIYGFIGTFEWVTLDHDPALSVDGDTYTVYNVTTDMNDASGEFEYYDYVGSWSSAKDEYRGATTSGTITDVKIIIRTQATAAPTRYISAIKFIEDGTAPDIIDKFIGPPEPDDSEAVTITAVTYDAIEVYEVTINAVVYPAGFSDVDYDLTEQIDDVLWSYEFSTLTAGYYLFQVTANDGANTYSEYIPIIVRVSAIEISTYTFFGASSDFTYMQYSGHISHDCTYNISEWSTTWAKNETHTGSITEGMFNIAWDKIGVDDAEANFTIVFVSGTLSLTIEGYYGTAYKALQVTEIDFVNLEQSDSWTTNLTINFYTNKEVDWTVYDRDNDDAVLHSGTTTEGDGFITWVQNTARGAHQFAVKWTDSISDQWYNNSYWVFDRNIDDLAGGADPGADQRRTIEFWSTVAAIAGILGIIVIALMYFRLDEKFKALQLPHYRTQERDRK